MIALAGAIVSGSNPARKMKLTSYRVQVSSSVWTTLFKQVALLERFWGMALLVLSSELSSTPLSKFPLYTPRPELSSAMVSKLISGAAFSISRCFLRLETYPFGMSPYSRHSFQLLNIARENI